MMFVKFIIFSAVYLKVEPFKYTSGTIKMLTNCDVKKISNYSLNLHCMFEMNDLGLQTECM